MEISPPPYIFDKCGVRKDHLGELNFVAVGSSCLRLCVCVGDINKKKKKNKNKNNVVLYVRALSALLTMVMLWLVSSLNGVNGDWTNRNDCKDVSRREENYSSLNGSNGEWTGKDCVKGNKGGAAADNKKYLDLLANKKAKTVRFEKPLTLKDHAHSWDGREESFPMDVKVKMATMTPVAAANYKKQFLDLHLQKVTDDEFGLAPEDRDNFFDPDEIVRLDEDTHGGKGSITFSTHEVTGVAEGIKSIVERDAPLIFADTVLAGMRAGEYRAGTVIGGLHSINEEERLLRMRSGVKCDQDIRISGASEGVSGKVNSDKTLDSAETNLAGFRAGEYKAGIIAGTLTGIADEETLMRMRAGVKVDAANAESTQNTLNAAALDTHHVQNLIQQTRDRLNWESRKLAIDEEARMRVKLDFDIANENRRHALASQQSRNLHMRSKVELTRDLEVDYNEDKRKLLTAHIVNQILGEQSAASDPQVIQAKIDKVECELQVARATKEAQEELAAIEFKIRSIRESGKDKQKCNIPINARGYEEILDYADRFPDFFARYGIPDTGKYCKVNRDIKDAGGDKAMIYGCPLYIGVKYTRRERTGWMRHFARGLLTPWKSVVENREFRVGHTNSLMSAMGWNERWGAPELAVRNEIRAGIDMNWRRDMDINNSKSILASYKILGFESSFIRDMLTNSDDWARKQAWTHTCKVLFHPILYRAVFTKAMGLAVDQILTDATLREFKDTWGVMIEETVYVDTITLAIQHASMLRHIQKQAMPLNDRVKPEDA